jgi:hypothetical protein
LRYALITLLLACGCATTKAAEPEKRTLPPPLVAAKLPERPDATPIPAAADWAVPCAGHLLEKDGQEPELVKKPGICMSFEKGVRAGRYVVDYNELRQLYVIDLGTWGRERQIYEAHLVASEKETERWREKSRRSWLEQNDGQLGLLGGMILGAGVTIAITAAVNEVVND